MAVLSLSKLAVAAGSLAVSLTAGAGLASAAPDLGPIVNTQCNYSQVMAALNTEHPAEAADFSASPIAATWLKSFLASPPEKRQQIANQIQAMPEAQGYLGTITSIAGSCNNY